MPARKSAKRAEPARGGPPSKLIDARIKALRDWRGATLSRLRRLIQQAVPDVLEEVKWRKPSNPMGVPVWSHHGILCTGETYQDKVKLTFAKGASLKDPAGLFNASLEGNERRAIDLREGDEIDEGAFKSLIRATAVLNESTAGSKGKTERKGARAAAGAKVKLLSGGNPQIAKAEGDGPVQAYIEAMPGWKCDAGRRLDALIVRTVPGVRKAVKWNSPFYGVEGRGWFLAFHCFTNYIKVTFFKGALLRPLPPVASKDENTRYFHIHEDGRMDEEVVAGWIRRAAKLPGWMA